MDNPFSSAPVGMLDACLVVEDDSIIRLDLEETLRGFGMRRVLGAASMEAALPAAGSAGIRFAVLDYELSRGTTASLAELLVARGIPTVFLTAHDRGIELPPALRHVEVIAKPFSSALLAEALLRAFAAACGAAGKDVCCVGEPG